MQKTRANTIDWATKDPSRLVTCRGAAETSAVHPRWKVQSILLTYMTLWYDPYVLELRDNRIPETDRII